MSVINMIKTVKRIHAEDVILVKIGEFYQAYGKDACILSFLFDYKVKNIEMNVYNCGFPIRALSKVQAELERQRINYVLVDRRNNYEVDEWCDNKDENKYDRFSEKAYTFVKLKERIDNVYSYLIMDINSKDIQEKLFKIEEVLKSATGEI